MIDTDKYEGLNEVIDRIINSDEIGVDDLLADSMVVKDGINELLAEVKRLREELFNTHAFYSNMEQMLAFAVGIKQGLVTDISMNALVDAVNRDYHDRLNEHMDGRLRND